ncbi:hypothetical protein BC828DRAFT_397846 [Blastocladiella britannica]|nr:hypothetical protein BC828DRAFT_397846 [Blastocladiella britannica]
MPSVSDLPSCVVDETSTTAPAKLTSTEPPQPPAPDLAAQISELEAKCKAHEAELVAQGVQTAAQVAQLERYRMRASRLEFAQREALHFLAKPLDRVLTTPLATNGPSRAGSASSVASSPTKLAGIRSGSPTAAAAAATMAGTPDMELVECVRFALQYLRAAHAAVAESRPVSPIAATGSSTGDSNNRLATDPNAISTGPPSYSPSQSPTMAGAVTIGLSSSVSTPAGLGLAAAAAAGPSDAPFTDNNSVGGTATMMMHRTSSSNSTSGHSRSLSLSAAAGLVSGSIGAGRPTTSPSPLVALHDRGGSGGPADDGDLGTTSPVQELAPGKTTVSRRGSSNTTNNGGSMSRGSGSTTGAGGQPACGSSTCTACRPLGLALDRVRDDLNATAAQLTNVERTLDYERVLRSRVQIAKDLLETELEELTAQLFSEANKLVEEEARKRDAAERASRGLERQLERVLRAAGEDGVKRTLELAKITRKTSVGNGSTSHLLAAENAVAAATDTIGGETPGVVCVDALELNGFQDFVRRLVATASAAAAASNNNSNSSSTAQGSGSSSASTFAGISLPAAFDPTASFIRSSTPPPGSAPGVSGSTSTTSPTRNGSASGPATTVSVPPMISWPESDPLVRRAFLDDIEPCLFMRTPHTGPASLVVGSFRRKLLDALATGQLGFRIAPPVKQSTPSSSSQQQQQSPKAKCTLCGLTRSCKYVLRLGPHAAVFAKGTQTASSRTSSLSGFSGLMSSAAGAMHLTSTATTTVTTLSTAGDSTSGANGSTGNAGSTPTGSVAVASDDFSGYPIDIFCRDRIVAASTFYQWVRSLPCTSVGGPTAAAATTSGDDDVAVRQRPHAHQQRPPIVELFKDYLRLRRHMSHARIGSADLFGADTAGPADYANIRIILVKQIDLVIELIGVQFLRDRRMLGNQQVRQQRVGRGRKLMQLQHARQLVHVAPVGVLKFRQRTLELGHDPFRSQLGQRRAGEPGRVDVHQHQHKRRRAPR